MLIYLFCFLAICDVTRELDDCKYRIHPMEKLYGLHNKETTTIYHCDCIHRSLNVTMTEKNQIEHTSIRTVGTYAIVINFSLPHRFTDHLKQLKSIALLKKLLWKFVSMSCIEISNSRECSNNTRFVNE